MRWIAQGDPAVDERRLALAREAVARDPLKPQCWHALLKSLRRAGAFDEACGRAGEALARFPDDLELRLLSTRALLDAGRVDAGLAAIERMTATPGAGAAAQRLHHRALMLAGRPEAAAALGRAIAGTHFAEAEARAAFAGGRFDDVVAICDAHLARMPGHTSATYWKALALARAGRDAEARAVLALDRFVAVTALPAPAGYTGSAAFRAAVAAEIASNPTLGADPAGKATRGGRQTRNLRRTDAPATEALLAMLRALVDDYAMRLPSTDDGFVRARPDAASLTAWAVVTGADGHQVSHHHSGGWLSGVCYIQAPRGEDGARYAGPLVLGGIDKGQAPWGTREIEPVPGRVVLFPSYIPHATRPTGAAGPRTIVAFDVVPEEAEAA